MDQDELFGAINTSVTLFRTKRSDRGLYLFRDRTLIVVVGQC